MLEWIFRCVSCVNMSASGGLFIYSLNHICRFMVALQLAWEYIEYFFGLFGYVHATVMLTKTG